MTNRYNPDDYERILAVGDEVKCDGCAFVNPLDGACLAMGDRRFDCSTKDCGSWIDYIFVVKNSKADEKGGK